MKYTKRIISVVLLLTLLAGMLPASVTAAGASTSVQNSQMTVEGTNSFGSLLSQDIQEHQAAEESYAGGYSVTDLSVENGVATVEYDSLEEAVLVVALYTEDGLQMLVSGSTVVQPEDTEAVVVLEGELPQYFMASAYLVDSYDYSPLCASYDTPMYTKEMQDLLASTTDDYDADKILNLDDDKTTNFAVYADSTKVLEYKAGVNTVISADDETATYVIGNADNNITGLKTGDIVAYAYREDEILIIKVADVAVSGNTATITGADLELEEVFSHVKMETVGDTADVAVDDGTADEGVSFEGLMQEGARTYRLRGMEGGAELSHSLQYDLKLTADKQTASSQAGVTVTGKLNLKISVGFSYYVTFSRQYIEFRTDANTSLNVVVTGRYAEQLSLGKLAFSPIPGVSIGFAPQLQVEFSGKIELDAKMDMAIGFTFENKVGFRTITKKPKIDAQLNAELTIYVGIDFRPTVDVLGGVLANATVSTPVGGKFVAKLTGAIAENVQDGESIHTCTACIDITVIFTAKISAKLQFLQSKKLTYQTGEKVFELGRGQLYWSLDHGELGDGVCPYRSYRTVLQVQDAQGEKVANAEISRVSGESWGKTNNNGVLVKYLPVGNYTVWAEADGLKVQKQFAVKEAGTVIISAAKPITLPGVLDQVNPEEVIENPGVIIAFGTCGENVSWELYSSGLLRIQGEGAMNSYSYPWEDYKQQITVLLIGEGVTNIGNYAFKNCDSMTSAIIGNGVQEIDYQAFYDCDSLQSIVIPESVTKIGGDAFYGCEGLISVTIAGGETEIGASAFRECKELKTVELGEGVTSIGDHAFDGCVSLTGIVIPNSVTNIGSYAFRDCYDMASVVIGNGVKEIRYCTFIECDSLRDVVIPESVTKIGGDAFYGCEGLLSVTIAGGETEIGASAFRECKELKTVELGEGVTSIGDHAFDGCVSLTGIVIPNSVTNIGSYAFRDCYDMASVVIGNGVKEIRYCTFIECDSLRDVVIPESVAKIGGDAFYGCEGLLSVTIPGSVTEIGNNAFAYCDSLTSVRFRGSAPEIGYNAFYGVTAVCYYPSGDASWTAEIMQDYGGTITWVAAASRSAGNTVTTREVPPEIVELPTVNQEQSNIKLDAMYGGTYETVTPDAAAPVKTASFSGLVPGEQYALLVVKQIDVENVLEPMNLLYMKQGVAAEDGTLMFTYVQRENTDISYVMACGAAHNNLKDAVITFPTMTVPEETQAVCPTVVFNGETLTEGVDYIIAGKTDYSEAGEYTCYIRGIYGYTGTVECKYTVVDAIPGDIDGDGEVTRNDVICLLLHVTMPGRFPIDAEADFNGDGQVTREDVIRLLLHVTMPGRFPL